MSYMTYCGCVVEFLSTTAKDLMYLHPHTQPHIPSHPTPTLAILHQPMHPTPLYRIHFKQDNKGFKASYTPIHPTTHPCHPTPNHTSYTLLYDCLRRITKDLVRHLHPHAQSHISLLPYASLCILPSPIHASYTFYGTYCGHTTALVRKIAKDSMLYPHPYTCTPLYLNRYT